MRKTGKAVAVAAGIALVAPATAWSEGLSGTRSGSYSGTIVKQEARPLGADHLVVSELATGKHSSSGDGGFMDGAEILVSETLELERGNGPQSGQMTMVMPDGSVTTAFTGRVSTAMADGRPVTRAEGTWRSLSGTGRYAGTRGSGTYANTLTGPTTFSGEWRGTLTEGEEMASSGAAGR